MTSTDQELDSPQGEPSNVMIEVLHVLLQGLRVHSLVGDHADYQKFQQDLLELEQRAGGPSNREGLAAAGAMAKAIEAYNQQTSEYIQAQMQELQRMLAMTTETVATISTGHERHGDVLREIEKQLAKTSAIEDLRSLRGRLSECLQQLSQETLQQRDQMAQSLAQLRAQLEQVEAVKEMVERETPPPLDPLTGLEMRGSAERALKAAIEERTPAYALLFLVNRLHLINARYGQSTGDHILLVARNFLASSVRSSDRIFRWTGPVFVALIERSDALSQTQTEFRRITATKLETTVSIGNRSVMLNINTNSLLIPLAKVSDLAALAQQMDAFVGEQAKR